MEKSILIVLIGHRTGSAVKVQRILTEMGCIIKTRLGIHEDSTKECADIGLIILELTGSAEEKQNLVKKLEALSEVKVKLVELAL